MNVLSVLVTGAVLVIFPVFIFYLFIRAVRDKGTRWWGIVILLSILTCYCTTMVGVAGLVVGGNATGAAAQEQRYVNVFREALTQTETLSEALARMDAVSAGDDYRIGEPGTNLRFRYVWLLGGCFLFTGANLMMFGPGRREKRHAGDCIMMTVAALVVFLTGIWQIAWGNGYAYRASAYGRNLTGWYENIPLDAIRETNAEIAAELIADAADVNSLNRLRRKFRELSGELVPFKPAGTEKAGENDSAETVDAANPAETADAAGAN